MIVMYLYLRSTVSARPGVQATAEACWTTYTEVPQDQMKHEADQWTKMFPVQLFYRNLLHLLKFTLHLCDFSGSPFSWYGSFVNLCQHRAPLWERNPRRKIKSTNPETLAHVSWQLYEPSLFPSSLSSFTLSILNQRGHLCHSWVRLPIQTAQRLMHT